MPSDTDRLMTVRTKASCMSKVEGPPDEEALDGHVFGKQNFFEMFLLLYCYMCILS